MSEKSDCRKFADLVRRETGMSIESAVYNVAGRFPRLADAIMDSVGAWPSSDLEIAILQRHWHEWKR